MRVLITTDAFPPVCGGSGWSTYELVKGLRNRAHHVEIIKPSVERHNELTESFDGFTPAIFPYWSPPVPYVRNYFKNELLYKRLTRHFRQVIRESKIDIVHAQHRLTGPPSIAAANREGIPSVCTIRDYWPVCYWSDLIVTPDSEALCPSCTVSTMTRCVRPRAGALWPLAIPMIPYMRSNLARKRTALSRATAVIAVSSAIATDLKVRAPELGETEVQTIPNPVDVEGLRSTAALLPTPLDGSYGLFVGKLEINKGVSKLLKALERAQFDLPFVVIGDGSERDRLERAAKGTGRDIRFTGWLPRDQVLAWMRHATLLVFPSYGPESLSRVLLEACVFGLPVAAMDTGGTGDIILHEQTGLLSSTVGQLGVDIGRLRHDRNLRQRLGCAAQEHVDATFSSRVVMCEIESLYERICEESSQGLIG